MANINVLVLSGNLTSDAEYISTDSGSKITRFSLAYNSRSKNRDTDEWEDVANYINCVIFGNYGEALSSKLVKGLKVVAHGELRYSRWTDEDGTTRVSHEMVVGSLDFISPKAND